MPRRVLYFHHGGTVGGAPLSLLFLIQQLDRRQYAPVVCFSADGPVIERYRQAGVEVIIAPMSDFSHTDLVWYGGGLLWMLPGKLLRYRPSLRTARRVIREVQPDLVHVNTSAMAAQAEAACAEGVPLVWHIREPLAQGYSGLRRRWLQRTIDRCANRVIAISHNDASRLLPSDRIRVIYNFVDFDVFDRSIAAGPARKKLLLSPAQHVVTMLGGVNPAKGTLTFVKALALVREHLPNVVFLVVGERPRIGASDPLRGLAVRLLGGDAYDRAVMAAAAPHLSKPFIRFTGSRDDIPDVIAASDLIVFPSVVPHFARPLIEAAAMGKPAVASDLGGPRELLVNGETGLLVPPGDEQALAEAIVAILSDPARAAAMGRAAYTFADAHFNARKNAAATIAVYGELLAVS